MIFRIDCRLAILLAVATAVASHYSSSADFQTRFTTNLCNVKTTNAYLKFVWIGRGKQDPVFRIAKCLQDLVQRAYSYIVLRLGLSEFVPIVFR